MSEKTKIIEAIKRRPAAALMTVLAATAIGGALERSLGGDESAKPPKLPTGQVNFSPVMPVISGDYQVNVNIRPDGIIQTLVGNPKLLGYATEIDDDSVTLAVGAKVSPTNNGGIEVDPLYGATNTIVVGRDELKTGGLLPMGGDYSMRVELGDNGEPNVVFGPTTEISNP